MRELLTDSVFFGVTLSILAYMAGDILKKKTGLAIFNPLLVSVAVCIAVLAVAGIDYETYNASAHYLSWFLTPATVCLAIPLYEQLELLKKNWKAMVLGVCIGKTDGIVSSGVCDPFTKIYHNGHWYGCGGGTGRICDHYRSRDRYHRCAGQYFCRANL